MTERTVTFEAGRRVPIAFVLGAAGIVLSAGLLRRATGLSEALSGTAATVATNVHFLFIVVLVWGVLGLEGVRSGRLGLSGRHLVAGSVAFVAVWAALNALTVGVAVLAGEPWGVPVLTAALAERGVDGLAVITFAAFAEEFAFRGYLQTRLIALRGDDSRGDAAVGLLAASALFAVMHVPGMLLDGIALSELPSGLVLLTLSGTAFGLLYELTHNLGFVTLVHALGNTWVLATDPFSWSGWPFVAFLVAVGLIYSGGALAYRRLALGTDLTPAVRRRGPAGAA